MTHQPTLKFRRLHEAAIIPHYQTPGAAGMDLHWDGSVDNHAPLSRGVWLDHEPVLLGTGVAVEIPEGYEGQIRPRSSLGKYGVHVFFGTIDNDYRGALKIRVMLLPPHRDSSYFIEYGDRIAQLVIAPVARATVEEVQELSTTARGVGSFGSTGR